MSEPETIEWVDRYSVMGQNGCRDLCEGTGWVPLRDPSKADGWRFDRCTECGGVRV